MLPWANISIYRPRHEGRYPPDRCLHKSGANVFGLDVRIMRAAIAFSVGLGVVAVGLLIRLLRRKSSLDETGSVSGQWLADQNSRADPP